MVTGASYCDVERICASSAGRLVRGGCCVDGLIERCGCVGIGSSIIGAMLFVGLVWAINKRFPETNLPADASRRGGSAIWLAMVCFAVLGEIVLQLARFSSKVSWALDWILGLPRRSKQSHSTAEM